MSPEEFANRYLNLTWSYRNKVIHASVHKYLAMDADICDQRKITGSKKMKSMLMDAIKTAPDIKQTGDSFQIENKDPKTPLEKTVIPQDHIDKTFRGKASPDQIEDVLWLATHLKFIAADPGEPKVEGREAAPPQKFADWYLGMDCSGFASNYLGRNENQPSIKSLDVGYESMRRKTIDSIKQGDIMVSRDVAKNDYKHIAVVVSVMKRSDSAMKIFTVESYGYQGMGVGKHDRDFVMSSPGVFVLADPAKRGTEYYIQPVGARSTPSQ